jgi:hypothetical protein
MSNFILRLYVAAQNHKAAAREDGFVTAEHLALAVVGIVLVGAAYAAFRGQIETFIQGLFNNDRLNNGQL